MCLRSGMVRRTRTTSDPHSAGSGSHRASHAPTSSHRLSPLAREGAGAAGAVNCVDVPLVGEVCVTQTDATEERVTSSDDSGLS